MSNRLYIVVILVLFSFEAQAQKVKYKDLIVLLTSKQFDKSEPFLKRYLRENNDNPNAFLYMGIIFQEKALKDDPLLHSESVCATIDSALVNYDKAYQTITDKELRKNDEYYEPYMRRDLRTGKFVIKLSDVQLDVENRTRSLKERKEKTKLLKTHFAEASSAYAKANGIYQSLQTKYGSEKEFFLRSDEEMTTTLKRLAAVFDSSIQAFDKYKAVSKELGKTGHNQVLSLQEIKDLKRDGSSEADFVKDDLKIWDYQRWSLQSIDIIDKEINPLRDHLVAYDIEINKYRAELEKDSVSVKKDLAFLVKKMESGKLKKYDPNPMPLSLFSMKVAELEYRSDMILNKAFHDTADVRLRLAAAKMEVADLKILDSLSTLLTKRNFSDEEKDYKHFISKSYGTTSVLQNSIGSTLDYARREKEKRMAQLDAAAISMKWIIVAGDSVPLFNDEGRDLKYKPLQIEQEKFTFGLAYKDSLANEGYFYTITPSRIPEVKVKYPVDKSAFKKRLFPLLKGLSTSDPSGNSFITIIYSTQKIRDKFIATVAKIYRSDGLSWSYNFSFDSLPVDLSLNNETGDIAIKTITSDGAVKIMIVDKTGKLK
jgi:hypothetical protein